MRKHDTPRTQTSGPEYRRVFGGVHAMLPSTHRSMPYSPPGCALPVAQVQDFLEGASAVMAAPMQAAAGSAPLSTALQLDEDASANSQVN